MLKRRHEPQPKFFAPSRVFASRYPNVRIIYRDGRPWERRVSSHGGQRVNHQMLVAFSYESLDAALAKLRA